MRQLCPNAVTEQLVVRAKMSYVISTVIITNIFCFSFFAVTYF